MRKAFSMIELIFVIVILGILAVVIVPKLTATRSDAEASTKAHEVMAAVSEISAYSVAVGQTDANLSVMSNSISNLVISGKAILAPNSVTISMGSVVDCVTIQITSAADNNLSIIFGNTGGDNVCNTSQSLIDLSQFPIQLNGTMIVN